MSWYENLYDTLVTKLDVLAAFRANLPRPDIIGSWQARI